MQEKTFFFLMLLSVAAIADSFISFSSIILFNPFMLISLRAGFVSPVFGSKDNWSYCLRGD